MFPKQTITDRTRFGTQHLISLLTYFLQYRDISANIEENFNFQVVDQWFHIQNKFMTSPEAKLASNIKL